MSTSKLHHSVILPKKPLELLEQRRQIFDAVRYEGLTRKEVVTRLGVSRQVVDYHLKFRCDEWEDWAELTQLRNDLADALTRERFYKRLIESLSRAIHFQSKQQKAARRDGMIERG